MKVKVSIILLILSAFLSGWLYWGNSEKIEHLLTQHEWQSKMVTLISDNKQEDSIGPLRKVELSSNAKYLPNGTYLRMSVVRLYGTQTAPANVINISETGKWDINDNYLLISPIEFKDVTSSQRQDFSEKQLELITQVIKMDAEQSRRIDIVNPKALLLTSLNHGSTVLFSN
ncbi:regulatory protein ToxS [Vibrio artabrorum]|uniref:Regulatory protein ToxS n=1 Tax=Vibrio artabrorum TaxID=446374 RepID=A0ABT8CHS1_9VIBR|nr:regulatory protein ToxS [Vibrio artabrorum]MDN3701256.1 regulatory protein ToxS [Vibrio artabrorum]